MIKRSLSGRLLAAMLLVFALGFSNLVVYLYGTRDALRRGVMLIEAQVITEGFTANSDPALLPQSYAGGELSYSLYAPEGQLLWMSDNLQRPRRLKESRSNNHRLFWSPYSGLIISVPVQLKDGTTLMVAKNDELERNLIGSLLSERLQHSLALLIPIGLISVGLILLLLYWTLRPVHLAARSAQRIGPADPKKRIPLDNLPNEIQPLAAAANSALDRFAAAYVAERSFVENAAHELRTPLTVLDLRLQASRRSGQVEWSVLETAMQQIRRMVTQLLELARQEGEAKKTHKAKEQANISRITREVTAHLLPLFEKYGRRVEVVIADGHYCRGQPDQLRIALTNLLENALVHGRGTVRVLLQQVNKTQLWIDVSDEGPNIPLESQELMFQRFHKGQQKSKGSGLGLAIVRQIAQNAGGHIEFIHQCSTTLRLSLYVSPYISKHL